MAMSKFTLKIMIVFFSVIASAHAEPNKQPSNIAVHIAKTHYLHPVRLLHPYLNVWHMKGPMAEKAAMASLLKHYDNVSECSDNSEAKLVLLLEPHMFYNAQSKVFHAEYIVRAYTSNGEPITRIKKQAKQLGPLNVAPEFFMQKAYVKAMDKVIEKLANDQPFLARLNQEKLINAGDICHQLDLQPLDKLYY
jgi:hypothetical protein